MSADFNELSVNERRRPVTLLFSFYDTLGVNPPSHWKPFSCITFRQFAATGA